MVSNLVSDGGCLALQSEQEAVQRLGLAGERSQESRQAGLLADLPEDVDDHLVHCAVLTCSSAGVS